MSEQAAKLSTPMLLALTFAVGGVAMLAAAKFAVAPPAAREQLKSISGVVVEAKDIKHYKEPAHTSSYGLLTKNGDSEPIWLDVVKQPVAPEALRALVGQTVAAKYDDGLIYELAQNDATLVSYESTASMIDGEDAAFRYTGVVCLVVGAGLLAWGIASGRRA